MSANITPSVKRALPWRMAGTSGGVEPAPSPVFLQGSVSISEVRPVSPSNRDRNADWTGTAPAGRAADGSPAPIQIVASLPSDDRATDAVPPPTASVATYQTTPWGKQPMRAR